MGNGIPTIRYLHYGSHISHEKPIVISRCFERCGSLVACRFRPSCVALIRIPRIASIYCSGQRKRDVGDHCILANEWQYTIDACSMVESATDRNIKYCNRCCFFDYVRRFKIWCCCLDLDKIRPTSWYRPMAIIYNAEETMSNRDCYASRVEWSLVDHTGCQCSKEEHQTTTILRLSHVELRDTRTMIGSDGLCVGNCFIC